MSKYFFSLFFFLTINTFSQNVDIDILRAINVDRNPDFDNSMKMITHSAAPMSVLFPLGIIAAGFIQKNNFTKLKGAEMALGLLINTGFTHIIKWSVHRPRPFTEHPEIEKLTSGGGYSFVSGHTSTSFALATSISIHYKKWYFIVPSFVWAGTVGYSRMHLGVHYPSDVVAGAALGAGSAILSYKINQWIQQKIINKKVHDFLKNY